MKVIKTLVSSFIIMKATSELINKGEMLMAAQAKHFHSTINRRLNNYRGTVQCGMLYLI